MNITIPFLKMHGLSNDFVIVDGRGRDWPLGAGVARALAHRKTGIGCDQVVVLRDALQADVSMIIMNADGGEVAACGNATRCVADVVMAERGADHCVIETQAGLLTADRTPQGLIAVDMGPARWDWRDIPLSQDRDTGAIMVQGVQGCAVNVGNPHCVIWTQDVATAPVTTLGPLIETDPLFPQRTNVEWAKIVDKRTIMMRVWERGVGETDACGTGACAAALCAHRAGLTDAQVTVQMPGGALMITLRDDGHVVMAGPSTLSFRGTVTVDI
ncbi:MAG: diaminopimelate epimerase [Alphaproteobacteria bacterium]